MNWISNPTKQKISWTLIVLLVFQCFWPLQSYALTGGPSQPEVESFTPIGTSEMVDVSTGDFSYNIPLLDVGGYPINLAYSAGITMDQEASMVGLGWNINSGVIKRNMRGLPDDFNGEDKVTKKFYMKPNKTWGGSFGVTLEALGLKIGSLKAKAKLGLFKNNMEGWGLEFGVHPSFSAGVKGGGYLNVGYGLTANSQTGLGISPTIGYSHQIFSKENLSTVLGLSIGAPISSRQGLKALTMATTLDIDAKYQFKTKDANGETMMRDGSLSYNLGSSSSYNFSNPTYTPSFQLPMINSSFTYFAVGGPEAFGGFGGPSIRGYYSEQRLMVQEQSLPAFGTLYAHLGKNYDGLMDYNRENDGPFTLDIPNLPLTVRTTDLFSVSGQGIGGSYQLKRGDVGIMYDKSVISISPGGSIGGELGGGNVVRTGGDVHFNFTFAQSGQWTDAQSAFFGLSFQQPQANNPAYEAAYFKRGGELVSEDENERLFTNMGKFEPVRILLNAAPSSGLTVNTMPVLVGGGNKPVSIMTTPLKRNTREKRTQSISYLTSKEANKYGLEKQNYHYSIFGNNNRVPILRSGYPDHHISEITSLNINGLRYVYGLPVYNEHQTELTFAIDNVGNCANGLVPYTPGSDDAKKNENGKDDYYSETITPRYAHSYLLTAIISEDYEDITGDGPTPDDLGSYTKFNYHRLYGGTNLYDWRIPYQENQANFNEGFKTTTKDDKANFLYGQKEYYIPHSIESKTQIAYFHYSQRHDSHGADGRKGGRNSNQKLRKLDRIKLYSIPDKLHSQHPVPIKSVHFEYDYSLCPEVPNNDKQKEWVNIGNNVKVDLNSNRGKLTLKKVYFKYGKSNKGQLSPYKFSYEGPNPEYHLKGYNRWGTFQPHKVKCDPNNPSCKVNPNSPAACNPKNQTLLTTDYPYVPQDDRQRQDLCATAWNLTKIVTPSCAIINVNYEADDYRYVQDKEAMQMFPIIGANWSPNLPFVNPSNPSSISELYNGPVNHLYLYFELAQPLIGNLQSVKGKIRDAYIRDLQNNKFLYFKALVDLTISDQFEYVPGYAEIEDFGPARIGSGAYTHGYIKLKAVCRKDREKSNCNTEVNPISKAAWQFIRLNLPKLAYGTDNSTGGDDESIIKAMLSIFNEAKQFIKGFNKSLQDEGYGRKLVNSKSFIRLYCPSKKKIAGTHRVSKITLNDTWQMMTGAPNQNFEYGQIYEYSKTGKVYGEDQQISTGVAAYEPIIGGDENPWRQPIPYKKELLLAPDNYLNQETPLGESFMPAPTIIYNQIKVRNLPHPNVNKTGVGYTIHKFYTAKDFPVKLNTTGVDPKPKKTKPLLKLLKIKNEDYMTASQGYSIELNDMHGKPRSQYAYDEFGTKISGIKYRYKKKGKQLQNEVTIIKPDGSLKEKHLMGIDYDMVADARESKSETYSGGVNLNNDNFILPTPIPAPIVSVVPLPSFSEEKTRFRSIVLTKIIRRFGILEKTIAFDQGSSVETRNLAYDYETGEPLLTRTKNEFKNDIFQLKIPAHWAYKGMQGAYQNIAAQFKALSKKNNGFYSVSNANFFSEGDELIVYKGIIPNINNSERGWVLKVNHGANEIKILKEDGDFFNNPILGEVQIIRSGHHNKQTTPIGTMTTLQKPVTTAGSPNLLLSADREILDASAVEFSEEWQTHCAKDSCWNDASIQSLNPEIRIERFLNQLIGDRLIGNGTIPPYLLNGGSYSLYDMTASCNPGNCNQYEFRNISHPNPNYIHFRLACHGYALPPGQPAPFGCDCDFVFRLKNQNSTTNDFRNITSISFNSIANYQTSLGHVYAWYDGFWGNVKDTIEMYRTSCIPQLRKCVSTSCGPTAGDIVNPYRLNIKGIHRPKKNWSYLTDRTQKTYLPTAATTNTNIETDGYFQNFSSFWKPTNNLPNPIWEPDRNDWVWSTEVTKFHPNGNELENRDTLNRFSAEILGYSDQMVVAVAANANYNQIAFDGFEDYKYEQRLSGNFQCPPPNHFGFDVMPDSLQWHTGKYSLKINAGQSEEADFQIHSCQEEAESIIDGYELRPCDCLGAFSPNKPGAYVLSAWVKEIHSDTIFNYDDANIEVRVGGLPTTFNALGQIIEGWQRIYGVFNLPGGSSDISVKLNAAPFRDTYFDDLRLHPFDASFKSYVYDDINLRFTYELDENNYFTKYEYNSQSGMLERVKKETERGVMTIQESRFAQFKQTN